MSAKFYLCQINNFNTLMLSGDLQEAENEFDSIVEQWIKYHQQEAARHEGWEVYTSEEEIRDGMKKGKHYFKQIRICTKKRPPSGLSWAERSAWIKKHDNLYYDEFTRLELSLRPHSLKEVMILDSI